MSYQLLPTRSMTLNEKLNALTRLVIVVTAVMFAVDYEYWLWFLVFGVLVVLIIKYYGSKKHEGFTIPPTYTDGSTPMTTVPPLFSEEKQLPPPMYDIYNATPVENPVTQESCESQRQLLAPPYPIYSQYLSDTTILPSENEETKNRDLRDAQMYMCDAFTRDTLQHRNDMTRIFTNKINREYRSGCYDQITPFSSW